MRMLTEAIPPVRHTLLCAPVQVVQVCAEHKKPWKLAKHLEQIQEGATGMRNPPRVLIFANRHAQGCAALRLQGGVNTAWGCRGLWRQ